MNERMTQLAARVKNVIEHSEPSLAGIMLMAQAKALADVMATDGDQKMKQENVEAAWNVAVEVAKELGENHAAIKLLRAMHKLGKAILDGAPEPTDAELGLTSNCFIATATFEDWSHPTVQLFCRYRDNYLQQRNWGRAFITYYYTLSPPLARLIQSNHFVRQLCRHLLIAPVAAILKWLWHIR